MNEPPPLPAQSSPSPPHPQPKKGMGCFAAGCLVAVIGLIAFCVVGGLGGWWIYNKAVGTFSADRAANVQVDQPDPAAVQQAETKLDRLRNAVRNKTEETIEFSATDLNALIARDPALAGMRGKVHVGITGDEMILDLSVPLNTVPLPGLKGRWFNGRAQFRVSYDVGEFSFNARSLETNGHRLESIDSQGFSASFLQSFSSSFTRNFNESFQKGQERSPQGREFWNQVKSLSVQNGQLIVVTKAGG